MYAQQLDLDCVAEVSPSYRPIKHQTPFAKSKVRIPKGLTHERILELASEIIWEMKTSKSVALTSPQAAKEALNEWLIRRYSLKDIEVFGMVVLDNSHNILEFRELSFGTVDCASVYPREVVKAVINAKGKSVVFFHNHPSRSSEISSADIHITGRIKDALATIDVRVLDHFIVAGPEIVSFAEEGRL